MLTNIQLNLIKETVNRKIIYINILGLDFVFRTLGYKEFEDLKSICINEKMLQDGVCNLTVIYPEQFKFSEDIEAGISKICSENIIKVSKVNDINAIMDSIEYYRNEQQKQINVCVNLIKSVFTEYKVEEILDWDWDRIIEYSMRAEQIIHFRLSPNIKLIDNREQIQENNKETTKEDFNKELLEHGISPTLYYCKDIANNVVNNPIIVGNNWDNEDVIQYARKEIERQK